MALKLTIDHSAFPKGHQFEIRGIGTVLNGETVTLTAEQEADYVRETGKLVQDGIESGGDVKVTGTPEVKSVESVTGVVATTAPKDDETPTPVEEVKE